MNYWLRKGRLSTDEKPNNTVLKLSVGLTANITLDLIFAESGVLTLNLVKFISAISLSKVVSYMTDLDSSMDRAYELMII